MEPLCERRRPFRGVWFGAVKASDRNYSNVHTDVTRLEELGLIERTDDGLVSVPHESVEIVLPLAQAA
jgi:predicted transcriptional regulator